MRVLTNMEMVWISGGLDSITVTSDPGGGGDDPGFPDPTDGGDDNGGGSEGTGGGGGGGGSAGEIAGAITEIVKAMKDINWGQLGIDGNELALKVTKGYNGEAIDTNKLNTLASADGVTLYTGQNGSMYGDRDGDGVIDTGILYNPDTGVISADYNCDGVGDRVITDITP